jgi:hypothetical protein
MEVPNGRCIFALAQTVITHSAHDGLHPEDVKVCLHRPTGDWGDLGEDDRRANQIALDQGVRLFSIYNDRAGVRFWIITEADRSATTVLLPEDY